MRKFSDYDEDYVAKQSPLRLFLKVLGVFIALSIVFGVVGLGLGWFKAGTDIISPENVKKQWQFAYDYDESLKGISVQWCTATKAETQETNVEARIQRSSQRIAIEQNYAKVKAEYDGRLRDAFRAGLVAPPDVPKTAPNLQENVTKTGCMN